MAQPKVREHHSLLEWCSHNEFGKQIIEQWTGQGCDGDTYTIDNIAYASNKKLLWKCSNNHTWVCPVSRRTAKLSNCPYCTKKGKRVIEGKDDLLTWCNGNKKYGDLLKSEWTGQCNSNGKQYDMNEVRNTTSLIFKWRCSKGHEWESSVYTRIRTKTTCPICRHVNTENDFESWCKNNGEYGKKLLSEWTGICLDDGKQYTPNKVAKASMKTFLWKCSQGHAWDSKVKNRTVERTNCIYCYKNNCENNVDTKIDNSHLNEDNLSIIKNDLVAWCNKNKYTGQKILQYWTGVCEDGKVYLPDMVSKSSTKKFQWKCEKGHIWEAKLHTMISIGPNCPICYKINNLKKIPSGKTLSAWCSKSGKFGSVVLSEWTGICLDDGERYDISSVSILSDKVFLWQCKYGHTWQASISSRIYNNESCRECIKYK